MDTGATTLILPADVAERLALTVLAETQARLADGSLVPTKKVSVELDLIVDPRNHSLRPNPDHPDGRIIDILLAA